VIIYKLLNECTQPCSGGDQKWDWDWDWSVVSLLGPGNKSHVKSVLILSKMSAGDCQRQDLFGGQADLLGTPSISKGK